MDRPAREPAITINGHSLTPAQATTVRVALESMAMSLSENGLGDDEHGRAMTAICLDSIKAIREVMYG